MKAGSALVALLLAPLLGWAVASSAIAAEAEGSPGFDYLYIVANEGGSSGGHTAIRFGRDVYHFQNVDDLLVLERDLAEEFLFSYALLGNRTVHSTRVAVSEETLSGLVERFRRRHRAQEAQLGVAGELRRDRELLEFLADREDDPSATTPRGLLSIEGLGYFQSGLRVAGERSATLDSLWDEIVRAKGPAFLEQRRREIAQEMGALLQEDPVGWSVEFPASVDDHPFFARSFSARWRDLRAGWAALDVLEQSRPLAPDSHHAPANDTFLLSDDEVAAFARYATKLEGQLVEVADSRRDDWGQTLLVGMARLVVLHRSIDTGRLVFLDTYPDESRGAATVAYDPGDENASKMLAENRRQLQASREYFRTSADPDELAWERLEERSNRTQEMLHAAENGGGIRVARGHLVPARSGPYPIVMGPSGSRGALAESAERARSRERDYLRQMGRLHRYELITQNCATAIFETIDASFDGSAELSRARLGGHVGGPHSLAFIPFVSARQVNERYRIARRETVLSYRERRLEEMREQEHPARVALRESNTFTAKSYLRHPDDSFFVFFTDQAPLLRPLFGAVNLVAALGESVVGLAMAPVDRGAILIRGLRGALFSLPELVFVNIRKGSNEWIPPDQRDLDPVVTGESRSFPAAVGASVGSHALADSRREATSAFDVPQRPEHGRSSRDRASRNPNPRDPS